MVTPDHLLYPPRPAVHLQACAQRPAPLWFPIPFLQPSPNVFSATALPKCLLCHSPPSLSSDTFWLNHQVLSGMGGRHRSREVTVLLKVYTNSVQVYMSIFLCSLCIFKYSVTTTGSQGPAAPAGGHQVLTRALT